MATLVVLCVAGCGAKTGLYFADGGQQGETGPDEALDEAIDVPIDMAPPPIPCIEVPRDVGPVDVPFALPVSLQVVDLFFLLDATASMIDEIETIRRRLRSEVVPGVVEAIPDAAFGVALVGEFPVEPHGPNDVLPYELRQPITQDVLQVEGALERLPTWGNFDEPEAQVEGLFQVATGSGLPPWIPPSLGCPGGGSGGVCFRREALPVVLLITDAPMNNGPLGVRPESRYRFAGPSTYRSAVAQLMNRGVLVIGLGARDAFAQSPLSHLRAIARDTGAVASDGSPLAFDIGSDGSGTGRGIVEAVSRLAAGTPLDVDAVVEDVPGDEFDARELVQRVEALRAEPSTGVREQTPDAFLGTTPGTLVTFRLVLDPSAIPEQDASIEIPGRVFFRANGSSRLERREVLFLIPGNDGQRCEN
ncbi:MAG: hypothetical protein AAF411_22125 [Myxococcota bacterium]